MTAWHELDAFTRGYVECALWSSHDESNESGGDPFDRNYSIEDVAPVALAEAAEVCKEFQETNADLLAQALELDANQDAARNGFDFWLTRNNHGAGFWDRGLGDIGDKLTEMSHPYGSCDPYLGDDGMIYFQ